MMRRLGLTKKEWEQMNTERFYGLLDQLPDEVRDAIDDAMSMEFPTITDVRRIAHRRQAPEHLVLAVYGYLPNDAGDYVHASVPFERVHVFTMLHLAAWMLHRETLGNVNFKVIVAPEARPQ